MAASPEPSPPEADHDNRKDTEMPPPPPSPTNDTSTSGGGGGPPPSTSPTPDQSPPPPPSPPVSPPPAPESSPPPTPESSPPPPPPVSPPPPPESPPPPSPPPSPPSPAEEEPSPSSSPSSSPTPRDAGASHPPPQRAPSPWPPAATPPPPKPNSTIPLVPPHPPPPGTPSSPVPPPQPASGNRVAGGWPPPGHPSPPPSSSSDVVLISGIVVGGFALLVFVIICLMCSRKKKKQRYYMDPAHIPPPEGNQQLYEEPSKWAVSGQAMNLPPPPGFMGTPVPSPWGPPPNTTSGEFSSGTPMAMQQLPLPAATSLTPSIGRPMSQFSYEDLAAATVGFSQANLLGQGGFGYVHKGVLPDTREVAVKSLKMGSGQGEREFQAEVEIISRVHHRHLVSLVGYCIASEQRLLVYEYVPNKTLEFHLHGKGQPVMDWATRLKIAVGSAKGLAYLHEDCHPRIIHRDIKAANILLDQNFEGMVADFGLAKLTCDNYTHVSTRVMGTFGYLAPEYASSGKLTEKSDVFSFGVMLLELISGRRPVDPTNRTMEDSLVDWARPVLSKAVDDGNFTELVDPRLEGEYIMEEMARMVACAAASIRHSARRRPKMSQIAHALEGESSLDEWNEGMKVGQSGEKKGPPEAGYNTMEYNADIMKFRKMVMSSQESNSSEYGTTSEYGMNPSSSSGGNSREMRPKQI